MRNGFQRITKLILLAVFISSFFSSITNQNVMAAQPATQIYTKKVFTIVYDPYVGDTNIPVTEYFNYYDGAELTNTHIQLFSEISDGRMNFINVDTQIVRDFPEKTDGYIYTPQAYIDCIHDNSTCHDPDWSDYNKIIDSFDLCTKLNNNEIDELWIVGGPYFGFYESALAGKGAFPYNGGPINNTSCEKILPIMGFNYEREPTLHIFGHRMEATMSQIYGGWGGDTIRHNWARFALVRAQSTNYNYSGCGSAHYPANGIEDYDYGNTTPVYSICEDFINYPDLGNPDLVKKLVSCLDWGCNELGYFKYWFGHLPHNSGRGPDGNSNDWWKYFMDPNVALADSDRPTVTPTPVPTVTPTVTPIPNTDLIDIEGNQFAPYITSLYSEGIITGYSDHTYRPSNPVTRQEFASLIARSYDLKIIQVNEKQFGDVSADNIHADNILLLKKARIIFGYEDGTKFRPEQTITREEAAEMIHRALNNILGLKVYEVRPLNFSDVSSDSEFKRAISYLSTEKIENTTIMSGYSTGYFGPKELLTREQTAKILYLSRKVT